jgi:hypothetical protein
VACVVKINVGVAPGVNTDCHRSSTNPIMTKSFYVFMSLVKRRGGKVREVSR